MSSTHTEVSETAAPEVKVVDPHEQLVKAFAGFPTKAALEAWKLQVPGHRLRVFPLPDGKRVFVLRGLTALELQALQLEASRFSQEKQGTEVALLIATRGQIWTNLSSVGKLTIDEFRAAGAGLAQTIHYAVLGASDFLDPVAIEELSFDI
jgi:hypothetical protein